ncbi:MAG: hypothetical protein ABIQ04_00865 [Candidatus Saccharimonadales bacterium]
MDDTNKPNFNEDPSDQSLDAEPSTVSFNTTPVEQNAPYQAPDVATPAAAPFQPASTTVVPVAPAEVAQPSQPVPTVQPAQAPTQSAFGNSSFASAPSPLNTVSTLPPKKSKKGLIIGGIIAAVAIVLIGTGVLAYNFWFQNPDKVIVDSIINASKAKTTMLSGLIKTTGQDKVSVVFDAQTKDSSGLLNVKVTFNSDGKDITVEGSGIVDKDNNLYIKIKNVKQLVDQAIGAEVSVPSIDALIAKVDNKWIKITTDDIGSYNEDAKKAKKCIDDTYAKFKDDNAAISEVTDIFQKNRFVVVSKELPSENGSLGYEITFDQAKVDSFGKAAVNTKIYKQLHDCDPASFPSDYTPSTATDSKGTSKAQLWISRWGHEITKFTADDDSDGTKTHVELSPVFNKSVTIDTPKDFVTFEELKNDISNLFTEN